MILANCVIEHLGDRRRAIEEMLRALRPGGYMAHAVPTRFWKAASLLLNPVGYPLRVGEKWLALRRARGMNTCIDRNPKPWPGVRQMLGRWVNPPIHGTCASHLAEYRSFARRHWVDLFTHPKLVPVAEVPLLSDTQFGLLRFGLLPLRNWLAAHGLESSRAFVMRKTG